MHRAVVVEREQEGINTAHAHSNCTDAGSICRWEIMKHCRQSEREISHLSVVTWRIVNEHHRPARARAELRNGDHDVATRCKKFAKRNIFLRVIALTERVNYDWKFAGKRCCVSVCGDGSQHQSLKRGIRRDQSTQAGSLAAEIVAANTLLIFFETGCTRGAEVITKQHWSARSAGCRRVPDVDPNWSHRIDGQLSSCEIEGCAPTSGAITRPVRLKANAMWP